jgi:hypothetical protein
MRQRYTDWEITNSDLLKDKNVAVYPREYVKQQLTETIDFDNLGTNNNNGNDKKVPRHTAKNISNLDEIVVI